MTGHGTPGKWQVTFKVRKGGKIVRVYPIAHNHRHAVVIAEGKMYEKGHRKPWTVKGVSRW